MEKQFKISLDFINKLGGYLSTKPWIEVKDILDALSKLEPIEENNEK